MKDPSPLMNQGGVWRMSSQGELARLKRAFHDVVEVADCAELRDFYILLNQLRNLYYTDPEAFKDKEALASNEIFWVKAAIGFMEALLHVRKGISEIQPGILSTRLSL